LKRLYIVFSLLITAQITFAQSILPTLKNSSGKLISLNKVINQNEPVIISFWATWCAPCIQELESIHEVYEDWQKESKVTLFAIAIDDTRSQGKASALAKGKGWQYEILFDPNQDLKRALNIANVPYLVAYFKGKLIYEHSGYTPGSELLMYKKIKAAIQ
jgi:thiol-disulfide isomerase/thioredoxin